ncbi:ribonuclease HII [Candidatus Azambacteria bacterium]|nr:ribonuclease HII [Candidatus Azambacteria bacterium]
MKYQSPTLDEEQKIWHLGHDLAVGVDEVGRGPLAGPVVAAACVFRRLSESETGWLLELGINDSKKKTEKQREKIFDEIKKSGILKYGIGVVDEKTIDKINILQASLLAMKNAVENLNLKNAERSFLLIDGRDIIPEMNLSQKAIIGGDAKVLSIAAASIIAKVTRDKMMLELDEKYPEYGFKKHKGYGTKFHFEMIKKHGPCEIHRRSFLHSF